ncbi:MAG: methyltransferase domain-containing protein [Chloroflexi bacterium]|nr:methyltransferase domain-containing protein [Chloroflexota bacterium]
MTREWDAATYDRIGAPMTRWGLAVLERLALRGDERVLDAGCGSGRVTAQLLERLPRGSVVALDASTQMIDQARERLAADADRVEFVVADLGRPLPIDGLVDAVLSTATFHWVLDHDALFRNLAAVMRPGAPLVAQCGGGDNLARVRAVMRDLGEAWTPWNFAWPDETKRRLAEAGFDDIHVWLHDEPTEIPPAQVPDFLRTVILGTNLLRRAPEEREPFVGAVAERLADGRLDYVRLNIMARRAGRGPR